MALSVSSAGQPIHSRWVQPRIQGSLPQAHTQSSYLPRRGRQLAFFIIPKFELQRLYLYCRQKQLRGLGLFYPGHTCGAEAGPKFSREELCGPNNSPHSISLIGPRFHTRRQAETRDSCSHTVLCSRSSVTLREGGHSMV